MPKSIMALASTLSNYAGLLSSAAAGLALSQLGYEIFGQYAPRVFGAGLLGAITFPGISYYISPSPRISDESVKEYSAMQLARNMFCGFAVNTGANAAKNPSFDLGITSAVYTLLAFAGEKFQRTSKKELEALLLEEKSSALDHS